MELVDRAWAHPGGRILSAVPWIVAAVVILPVLVIMDVPVLRQVAAFVALFLLPGALLLCLLRPRGIDYWEFLAYACGLSLAFIMALGLALNGLHGFGLERPISAVPLAVAVGVATALLGAGVLWRGGLPAIRVPVGELLKPYTLLLLLPVAGVVLGAQMLNARQDNTLLLAALGLVAVLPLAAFVPRLLPERAYPLAVVAISLALLLHRSLISFRLTGFDIHQEYYMANLVLREGVWDTDISHPYNFALSVIMVPPIFSAVAGVDLLAVFKGVYPVLFSLMPLALFLAYRSMAGPRLAFLAVVFFVATQPFFQLLPQMARMQMAMLFLALLLLTMRRGGVPQPIPLLLSAGLIVSHYAVAYTFIPLMAVALGLVQLQRVLPPRLARVLGRSPQAAAGSGAIPSTFLRPNFANLFTVLAFLWFAYVSVEALLFSSVVESVRFFTEQLPAGFAGSTSQGLYLTTVTLTPLREVARYIHFTFQFFMVVGVLVTLLRWRRGAFRPEFVALAFASLIFSSALLIVPFFASSLGIDRWYIVLLLFLAPFAIIGGLAVFQVLVYALRLCLRALARRPLGLKDLPPVASALPVLAAGLGLYLLFNTGFFYEIAQDRPNAIPLSRQWMLTNGNPDEKLSFLAAYPADEDFAGGDWLASHRSRGVPIYADSDGWAYILREWIPQEEMFSLYPDIALDEPGYVFLRYLNTQDDIMAPPYGGWVGSEGESRWSLADLEPQLDPTNVIYSNGSSRIHMTRSNPPE
jgi:uncharacterized membrane protein